MSPVQRFNSIVIALTTLIMYGTWFGIDRVIEINKGTVIITSILSGFISLGFYRGIASILSKILIRVSKVDTGFPFSEQM